jgi:acetyltransferase-like isoleucine patch superfamily enzyme
VTIGSFCSFGEQVRILAGGVHRVDWVSTFPFGDHFDLPGRFEDGHPAPVNDTSIGHDVWVGREVLFMPGVTVGHGAVIGARAVVTHDVAPYSIVAGLPAREIRWRFQPDQVERLLALAWWDRPDEKILGSLALLNADGGIDQI